MDNSKEGLMFQNQKPSFSSSFEPISEKQEEMSISSIQGNNQNKTKNSNKNSYKNSKENIAKNVLDDVDVIRHCQTQKNKNTWQMASQRNNVLVQIKEENINEEIDNQSSANKASRRKITKKKILKRISVQGTTVKANSCISLAQVKSPEFKSPLKKKGSLGKRVKYFLENSFLKNKQNQENSFNKSNSISNVYEMKYFNQANKKKTILSKGKLNFNDKTEIKILDQIKNSDLFEKRDFLIFKLKICYGILALFSLICIILNCADAIIYNNKSLEHLYKQNNGSYDSYKNNIESYFCINNRKISSKENCIRLFNGIFSLICVFILIIIYYIRNVNNEDKRKNTKKERFKRMLNQYYSKQKKKNFSKKKKQEDEKVKNEKIKVINFDQDSKGIKDEVSSINDRNKTIRMCIINIIFYPPYINKAFIGKYNNIIYIYSLNSIFLILSLAKISNIYSAIFYLSSINNSFNKGICKSHFIILDAKFMFKYSINKFPLTFLFLSLILVFFSFCFILSTVEFFGLDTTNNFWNNYIEDKSENFFNISFTFFFFILRKIHEAHCVTTIFGKMILYFGGAVGMLMSSYFIFYANNLIEFSPEEHNAFSKLTKLLNPLNKEHKASNVIKSFLFIKKAIVDNKNIEKDYRLKIEILQKPPYNQRKPIFPNQNDFQFGFNSNINGNNIINYNEINEDIEKKKFIKYLGILFLFKSKLTIECKNFMDNLKIARNSSQSFNDVLKTIGNKMEANINQLNNKLEVLIRNDQKFLNFTKLTTNVIKRIKKLDNYHNSLLQYLVEIHNEYVKQMIEIKKEIELNTPIVFKSSLPKRMKSNMFGKMNFRNKIQSKTGVDYSNKKKRTKNDEYNLNSKFRVKKQKSLFVYSKYLHNNTIFEEKMKQARLKQNTNKSYKSRNKSGYRKRTNSFDDYKIIGSSLQRKNKERNSFLKKVGRSASVMNRDKKFIDSNKDKK